MAPSEHGQQGHVVSFRGERVEWLPFGQQHPVVARIPKDADWWKWAHGTGATAAARASRWATAASRDSKGRFASKTHTPTQQAQLIAGVSNAPPILNHRRLNLWHRDAYVCFRCRAGGLSS